MKKTKCITAIVIMTFITILATMCFAAESVSRQVEGETIASPSELLGIHRCDFLTEVTPSINDLDARSQTARLVLMTNVVRSVTQTKQLSKEDVEAGTLMISSLFGSSFVKTDKDAVLYLLNTIPAIQPVATNEYARELKIAEEADVAFQRERRRRPGSLSVVGRYRGPNVTAAEKKWRMIFEHNRNCSELRSRSVNACALAFPAFSKSMDANDFEALVNDVKKMDELTAVEKSRILDATSTGCHHGSTPTVDSNFYKSKDGKSVRQQIDSAIGVK